jgi:ferritin-like protein
VVARWEKELANPSYLTKIKGLRCWDSYSIPVEFTLPDSSDVASIGEYGLQRLNAIIGAYEAFLDQVRGTDDLSFHLVLDLLAAEIHQRADLQAALAQRS